MPFESSANDFATMGRATATDFYSIGCEGEVEINGVNQNTGSADWIIANWRGARIRPIRPS